MKRLISFLLLVILSGCGSGVPDIDGADWCFKYDFRLNDQGFNIVEGSWSDGFGLLTDAEGDLIFNYDFGTFIEPRFVVVVVQRPSGVSGPIAISAAGDVYGISATFNATLPDNISTYPVVAEPDTVGISGRAINITAQADQDLLLQSIEVRGMGSSPFGTNHCDDSQPLTPSTDTATPEFTYTPSATAAATFTRTASPTATFTPSPTPEGNWICDYDFTVSDQGWVASTRNADFSASYIGATGWRRLGSDNAPDADIEFEIWHDFTPGSNINRIESDYNLTSTGDSLNSISSVELDTSSVETPGITIFNNNSGVVAGTHTSVANVSHTTTADGLNLSILVFSVPSGSDSVTVSAIRIYGDGSTPSGCTTLPDPTATPSATATSGTPTATMTVTAAAGWTCTMDFDESGHGWVSAFNAEYADITAAGLNAWRAATTAPANSLGIRYTSPGVMPLTSVRIKGRTFGTRLDDPDELNFRTYLASWSSFTQDSHDNTAFDETYSYTGLRHTNRLEVYLSVTQTGVTATRIELIELRGVGGTNPCADPGTPTATMAVTLTPSGTGTGTLTPRPLLTGTTAPASRTPIVFPTFNIMATLIPGTPGTGTPPTAETGTPSTAIPAEQIGDESGEIIGFTWQIGWGLFRTLFAWVGQVTDDIGGLLDAFINTAPEAIPGLPQCMTRPLDYDICAVYYIMDWTLFAPNTPGAFIIPVMLLIMNLYMFMKFVSWVLRLIRRGESATNVQ